MKIKNLIKKNINRLNRGKIQFLIWDFDGTLYEDPKVSIALKQSYLDYLKKNNVNLSEKVFDQLAKYVGSWGKLTATLLETKEAKLLDQIDHNFRIDHHLEKNLQIVNFIEGLSEFRHIILSNSSSLQVERGLKKIGFKAKKGIEFYPFEKIFSRDKLKKIKPHKSAFIKTMAYTQLKPIHHLVIGDSYHHDIEPAKNLGMQTTYIHQLKKYLGNYE